MIRNRSLAIALGFLLVGSGILWLCTFKIVDRDFWWHVKAGEIMAQTGKLITVDPFAHTRVGKPYLSSHQWLAQVVLYEVWQLGGPVAQILFRGLLVAVAFSLLLLIDRKRVWPNFFIILIAAYFNRPSFMDRPQLFSFVFFCAFLLLATQYLRRSRTDHDIRASWRKKLFGILLLLQVLWVNTHGAAATYGIIVLFALLAERGILWLQGSDDASRKDMVRELKYLGVVIIIVIIGMFISPNGLRTFQDVSVYTSDQTLGLVREWQPRGLKGYMTDIAPFVALGVLAVVVGKRNRIFSIALLIVLGYLSTQAYRHGIFFIFSVLAIAIYQAGSYVPYRAWWNKMMKNPRIPAAVSLVLLIGMVWFVRYNDIHVLEREGYSGYGIAAFAESAYDFIETHNIQGNMFNTYAIGDYLLYRGYPDRKVYIDGRNIDYGYEFLREATSAAFDPVVWSVIEHKYNLTYAVIEYPLAPGASPDNDLPYVVHLSRNKEWALVYLDDKIAVYLKRTSENEKLIGEYEYTFITPESVEFGKAFEGISKEDEGAIEKELERAAESAPSAIKAKLLLAHHYADVKKHEEAARVANAAADAQPYRPEVYEALGIVATSMGQWARAGSFLEESIEKTGGVGLPINYNYLADVFANAGDVAKSSYYRQKAK